MGHDHSHHHHAHGVASYEPTNRRRLTIAFGITALYFVAEVVGGYLANSLALLSDAAHMFTDVIALGMAYFAAVLASRPANKVRTYGLYRVEVLAALANGVVLLVVVGKIIWEALERLREPPEIHTSLLLSVAGVGLIVNLVSAFVLWGGRHTNLNVRGAFLHILGDLLGSLAVIVGGVVIVFTGYTKIDVYMSFVVAALVLVSALRLIRDAVSVLLEGAPVDVDEVAAALSEEAGIESVHDLHVWSLTPGVVAMTAHLVLCENHETDTDALLDRCKALLKERFAIEHPTLQIEITDRCTSDEAVAGCALEAPRGSL